MALPKGESDQEGERIPFITSSSSGLHLSASLKAASPLPEWGFYYLPWASSQAINLSTAARFPSGASSLAFFHSAMASSVCPNC